jgi:hypothetical protein
LQAPPPQRSCAHRHRRPPEGDVKAEHTCVSAAMACPLCKLRPHKHHVVLTPLMRLSGVQATVQVASCQPCSAQVTRASVNQQLPCRSCHMNMPDTQQLIQQQPLQLLPLLLPFSHLRDACFCSRLSLLACCISSCGAAAGFLLQDTNSGHQHEPLASTWQLVQSKWCIATQWQWLRLSAVSLTLHHTVRFDVVSCNSMFGTHDEGAVIQHCPTSRVSQRHWEHQTFHTLHSNPANTRCRHPKHASSNACSPRGC